MANGYLKELTQLPPEVKRFAKRVLIMFIGWVILYYPILKPLGIPDKYLTHITATSTAGMLNAAYGHTFSTMPSGYIGQRGEVNREIILLNGQQVMGIADACNAFDLVVLYVCFLFCVPGSTKRRLVFAIAGTLTIFLINITRCYTLTIIGLRAPKWLDFAHHYLFTIVVYVFIFAGWVWYAKNKVGSFKKLAPQQA